MVTEAWSPLQPGIVDVASQNIDYRDRLNAVGKP